MMFGRILSYVFALAAFASGKCHPHPLRLRSTQGLHFENFTGVICLFGSSWTICVHRLMLDAGRQHVCANAARDCSTLASAAEPRA